MSTSSLPSPNENDDAHSSKLNQHQLNATMLGRKNRKKKDNTIDLCLYGSRGWCSKKALSKNEPKIDSTIQKDSKSAEREYDSNDDLSSDDTKSSLIESSAENVDKNSNVNRTDQPAQLNMHPPHHIDLQNLRRLASQGIPDNGSHRSVAWRVLLGFLPCELHQWEEITEKDRTVYRSLVAEFFSFIPNSSASQDALSNVSSDANKDVNMSHGNTDASSTSSNARSQNVIPDINSSPTPNSELEESVEDGSKDEAEEQVLKSLTVEDKSMHEGSHPGDDTDNNGEEKYCSEDFKFFNIPSLSPNYAKVDHLWRTSILRHSPKHKSAETLVSPTNKHENNVSSPVTLDHTNGHGSHETVFISENNEANTPVKVDSSAKITTNIQLSSSNQMGANSKAINENISLLEEIRKDVVRTHPDLHFFLESEKNLGQLRYAALERILYVWAKLNKGVRYVQGMNEIVGTIYFVLANDSNKKWADEAEADTYFLFNTLMVEIRDVFVPDLDEAATGIQGRISSYVTLLCLHDPEVKCHLDDIGIDASFYSVRWLTTLLSREFLLPDTIRLWDSMFASTHKDNFLRYVCVTMVMAIREKLLQSDFSQCLRLLQSYPPTNIDRLLESSRALWIYESQVTLACHKGGISLQQALMTIAPPPAVIMAYGYASGVANKTDVTSSTQTQRSTTTSGINSGKPASNSGPRSGFFNFATRGLFANMSGYVSDAGTGADGRIKNNNDSEKINKEDSLQSKTTESVVAKPRRGWFSKVDPTS